MHGAHSFVPASGAASRMFKDLFEGRDVLASGKPLDSASKARKFVDNIGRFAFYTPEDFSGLTPFGILDHVIGQGASASGRARPLPYRATAASERRPAASP